MFEGGEGKYQNTLIVSENCIVIFIAALNTTVAVEFVLLISRIELYCDFVTERCEKNIFERFDGIKHAVILDAMYLTLM